MIVAEALGKDEALAGVPLVGTSGKVLNRMLSRVEDPARPGERLKREDFVLANVINCRPPNNELTKATYEHEAIDRCRHFLRLAIETFKPRAILALGNQPLRWFTGQWGIEQLRGYKFDWVGPDGRSIPVIPTYHPAFIARGNWKLVRVWQLDLLKALALAEGRSFEAEKRYHTHPTPMEFERWVRGYFEALAAQDDSLDDRGGSGRLSVGRGYLHDRGGAGSTGADQSGALSGAFDDHGLDDERRSSSPTDAYGLLVERADGRVRTHSDRVGPFLSFDIETPYIKIAGGDKDEKWNRVLEDDHSWTILRISFAYKPFEAISVPWTAPYLDGIRRLLASTGDKVVWNRHFDVPRVAKNGCPAAGRVLDGMELWHYLEPSLPMGLKYVATFHCPDMRPWKLVSHSEPEWYNAADSDVALRTVLAMIDTVRSQGRWDLYLRHVVELGTILDGLTIRGINVDREQRRIEREKFEADLLIEEAQLQQMVPVDVLPLKVYKSDEAKLRATGAWVEGRMIKVSETLTEKEREAWKRRLETAQRQAAKAAAVLMRKQQREEKRRLKESEKESKRNAKLSSEARKQSGDALATSAKTPVRARRKTKQPSEAALVVTAE